MKKRMAARPTRQQTKAKFPYTGMHKPKKAAGHRRAAFFYVSYQRVTSMDLRPVPHRAGVVSQAPNPGAPLSGTHHEIKSQFVDVPKLGFQISQQRLG